jgi:hypothetical protein
MVNKYNKKRKVGLRSASMRALAEESTTSSSVATVNNVIEYWTPVSYSLGKESFVISNKNAYHPFCFDLNGDAYENYNTKTTADFKDYLIFKEDRISSSDPVVFTCYQFPFNNTLLIVPYLDAVFGSVFIYGTASYRERGILNKNMHLFRFFDDTYCGCGLVDGGGNTNLPGGTTPALCPGTKKNDYDEYSPQYDFSTAYPAEPGAIILVDRASEINTVSGVRGVERIPAYVTRPLSTAIIDYCEKIGKTPEQLLPNLIWDEKLVKV